MSGGRRSRSQTRRGAPNLFTGKRNCEDKAGMDTNLMKKMRAAIGPAFLAHVNAEVNAAKPETGAGKRSCVSGDEADRSSPTKKMRPTYPAQADDAAGVMPVVIPPKKLGRKKKNQTPGWMQDASVPPRSPSTLPQPHTGDASSSGLSSPEAPCEAPEAPCEAPEAACKALETPCQALETPCKPLEAPCKPLEAPCKAAEKHVHFLPEDIGVEDVPPEMVEAGCSGSGVRAAEEVVASSMPGRDQGVQVNMENDVTSVHRSVQTIESSMGLLEKPKPVEQTPEVIDLEPQASCSKIIAHNESEMEVDIDYGKMAVDGVDKMAARKKQQVVLNPEAGSSGLVDAGCGRRQTRSGMRCVDSAKDQDEDRVQCRVFAEHPYVKLELFVEFLILCLVVWFFKYR